ncbi:MAG: ECF transporter S component [Clostridia bacterium]|nr:ECF transporter S component [Clostridia bacterium]
MKKLSTRDFVLLAVLIAILMVLGVWNIPMPGGLSITFNMIPLAIAAIFVGPLGGLIVGVAFGLISFAQCFSILGYSLQGAMLLQEGVMWYWLLLQRLLPRALDGLLLGFLYRLVSKKWNVSVSCAVTGFFAAFLNTAMFMSLLYIMFRNTTLLGEKMAVGFFAYIFATVGINGLVEMAVSTLLTGAVGTALYKAGYSRK